MSVKIDGLDAIASFTSIQGNIAGGKSTLMAAIDKVIASNHISALDTSTVSPPPRGSDLFVLVPEPVDKWLKEEHSLLNCDGEGDPRKYAFLHLFYAGMKPDTPLNREAFPFQVFTFTTRFRTLSDVIAQLPRFTKEDNVRIHIIAERSVRADRLFFKNVYESKGCLEYEWRNYEQFHDTFCRSLLDREDLMVRLNTTAKTSYQRLYGKRMREAEVKNAIPLTYLESLERQHEEMYAEFAAKRGADRIFDVNFEQDMNQEDIAKIARNLIEHIKTMNV